MYTCIKLSHYTLYNHIVQPEDVQFLVDTHTSTKLEKKKRTIPAEKNSGISPGPNHFLTKFPF